MVLDAAAFTPLRLPSSVDVPAGALNSTGVTSTRSELLLRSCSSEPFADQMAKLRESVAVIQFELGQPYLLTPWCLPQLRLEMLLTYPPCHSPHQLT